MHSVNKIRGEKSLRLFLVIALAQDVLLPASGQTDSNSTATLAWLSTSSELLQQQQQQTNPVAVQINERQKYHFVAESSTTKSPPVGGCKLGNDSYSIGDKWNPDLPPHGIQVCVLCECIFELREAKVTCRRIAKDCPRIESCPFGERPVAPQGQCCKSCLSHNILGEGPMNPAPPTVSSSDQVADGQVPPLEQNRSRSENVSDERDKPQVNITTATTSIPRTGVTKISKLRPSNKELNTKDSRLAFKSLEPQNRIVSGSAEPIGVVALESESAKNERSPAICKLGNDTYTIGDNWSPNLPPFGIQVCVLCECVARLRKACYEAKVTCRRIANECPVIESCTDGKEPITAPGKCCKSCPPSALPVANTTLTAAAAAVGIVSAANASEATALNNSTYGKLQESSTQATGVSLVRNESIIVAPQPPLFSIRDLPLCKRDGSDSNVGSISKRSRGSIVKKSRKYNKIKKSKKNSLRKD